MEFSGSYTPCRIEDRPLPPDTRRTIVPAGPPQTLHKLVAPEMGTFRICSNSLLSFECVDCGDAHDKYRYTILQTATAYVSRTSTSVSGDLVCSGVSRGSIDWQSAEQSKLNPCRGNSEYRGVQ